METVLIIASIALVMSGVDLLLTYEKHAAAELSEFNERSAS